MQTFYIDIYFLINFTVDILALYVAVRVLRAGCRLWRLVLSAALGALVAVIDAFLYSLPIFSCCNLRFKPCLLLTSCFT